MALVMELYSLVKVNKCKHTSSCKRQQWELGGEPLSEPVGLAFINNKPDSLC